MVLYGSNNIQEESCSEFGDLIELKKAEAVVVHVTFDPIFL